MRYADLNRKPDFLIIGAQKAASTYVQFCLSEHPDIWIPKGETPYFEDPDYEQAGPEFLQRFVAGRTERLLGLKRPQWIGRSEVPARICLDLPEARLIAILRNPVERVVSAYYHYMRGAFLPVLDPDIGLTQLLDGDKAFATAWPRSWEVLEFGLYHKHLSRYSPYFARDRICVLLQEDVIADPLASARSVYAFLGVDNSFTPKRLASRPQAVVYNLRRLRFMQIVGRLTVCTNADNTRSSGYRNLVAAAGNRAWRGIDGTVLERVFPSLKPRLSARVTERLQAFYRDDIERLQDLIGRDLTRWMSC
jgi:hypothetical protein